MRRGDHKMVDKSEYGYEHELVQKTHHGQQSNAHNESKSYGPKPEYAEKVQNKLHCKGIDTIANEAAVKQKLRFQCPLCIFQENEQRGITLHLINQHKTQLKALIELLRGTATLKLMELNQPVFLVLCYVQNEIKHIAAFTNEPAADVYSKKYNREHYQNGQNMGHADFFETELQEK
jgi:hypothetical protein